MIEAGERPLGRWVWAVEEGSEPRQEARKQGSTMFSARVSALASLDDGPYCKVK